MLFDNVITMKIGPQTTNQCSNQGFDEEDDLCKEYRLDDSDQLEGCISTSHEGTTL